MPAVKVLPQHLADEGLAGRARQHIPPASGDLDLGWGLLCHRHHLAELFSIHLSKGEDDEVDGEQFNLRHEQRTRAQDLHSVYAQAQLAWIIVQEPDELVRPPLTTRDQA